MRVLILSLDRALISKSGEGDTFRRFQAYKKTCQSLTAIVPTNKKSSEKTVKGVKIIPAYDPNNHLTYWQVYQLAKRVCNQEKIDLIVVNDAVLGAIAVWLRRKFSIKVQIHILGLEILNKYWRRERFQNIFLKWVQEWAIRRADGIRVDNKQTKRLLIDHYQINSQKVVVIPVTPSKKSQERFLKVSKDQQLKEKIVGKNKRMILSVGSLVKAKDIITFIKAAKVVIDNLPNTVVVIAGEGPERDKIEEEIEKRNLKDKIRLLGSVEYEELPQVYTAADLFILSSSHEGFPRVLMEAALSGKPIITTAIDGAGELVENDRTGLIVPIKKPRLLARAIEDLLKDEAKAERLGKEARKRAKKLLDFETSVKKINDSWEELLKQK